MLRRGRWRARQHHQSAGQRTSDVSRSVRSDWQTPPLVYMSSCSRPATSLSDPNPPKTPPCRRLNEPA